MSENKKNTSRKFDALKLKSIVFIYESVFQDHIYKSRDMEQFYEQIREMLPGLSDFFIGWFKAFVCVAKHDFSSAEKNFTLAFEDISSEKNKDTVYDISDYVPSFLQQAFALFKYEKKDLEAQKFWDFGVDRGFFLKDSTRYFEQFEAKEQFWIQFGPNVFTDFERAEKEAVNDYKKSFESSLEKAIVEADFSETEKSLTEINLNSFKIKGVSPLYYAVQIKGIISGELWKYVDDIVEMRTEQLFSSLDESRLSPEQKMQHYMTIKHQMKLTYDKSGLAKIMFRASYCDENQIEEKTRSLEKIIALLVEKTDDVDLFVKQIEGAMGTNVLHLAAEVDDVFTCRKLLEKKSNVNKSIGSADFGMKYAGGKTVATKIPNTFIYRLISFKSWNVLRMYLSDFSGLAEKSMTEKSEKYNITPLVFMILNTVYSSENETQYAENKKIVDEFIPLFVKAGSVLDENTAFGTAKKLLGL